MKQREVGEAYEASTSALEAAKGQRLSLRRAIAGLEDALAAADDPDGLGGQDTWQNVGLNADGKGQPQQLNAMSHGCPPARFRGINVLNTRTESGR